MIAYVCTRMPAKVLFWQGSRAVHMIHRIISAAIGEPRWCGQIYGMQFACSMVSNVQLMQAAIQAWLERDLRYHNPTSGMHPDPAWHRHATRLVDNTIRSRADRIRGRIGNHGASSLEANGRERLDYVASKLLWVCNGDWWSPTPEVFDDGRFGSRAKAVRMMAAAICESGILLGGEGGLCSVNRWGSLEDSLDRVTLGFLLHGCLAKGLCDGLAPRNERAQGQDDPEDDWRIMLARKVNRARTVVADPWSHIVASSISFCTQACGHLWHRVQHTDEAGGSLKDILSGQCLFRAACRQMCRYMEDVSDEQAFMHPLFFQFAPTGDHEMHNAMLQHFRHMVVSIAVQLWWRFILWTEESWGLRLIRIFDETRSAFNRNVDAHELWYADECCVNRFFSGRARWLEREEAIYCIGIVLEGVNWKS